MILYIVAILLAIYFAAVNWRMRKYKLPPGPPALPILGSLPFLEGKGMVGKLLHPSLEKYGKDFCSIWTGNRLIVVIQDIDLCRDLLSRDEFSSRVSIESPEVNVRGHKNRNLGIAGSSGSLWQQQRRFALKHLRDFGFGKQSLDSVIQDEAEYTIEKLILESLSNERTHNVKMEGTFNIPVVNVLWRIVASYRNDPDSEENKMFMKRLGKFFSEGMKPIEMIPYIGYIRPYTERELNVLEMKEMFKRRIREHQIDFDEMDEPRDFIDVFLRQIEVEKQEKGDDYNMDTSNFHIEQLTTICLDFFAAGSETTSTTLTWAIMYMALYPKVQEMCQKEIEEHLQDRLPTKNNMQKLVYCFSTIQEIQRISSVASTSLPHGLTKDITVNGYHFPAGTSFIANLKKFMYDPNVFPRPEELIPERFIEKSDDGSTMVFKKIKNAVPFGIGKRICLGESLAKSELFIFFVMLLQRLTFLKPEGEPEPNPKNCSAGMTNVPNPFYVSIQKRK